MRKEVKEYMDSVVMTIVKKYHLSEIESYKAVNLFFMILLSISRKKRYMMI